MKNLVTIIISTYNSSDFIIETLDSVLCQTYKNIELIITDDSSEDKTVELCNEWLIKHNDRFAESALIHHDLNTGVPANANRGLRAANGEWIKFLGADDTLKPDCIESNMSWIENNPEVKVLFSAIEVYNDTFDINNLLYRTPGNDVYFETSILNPKRDAQSQYKMLLLCDRIHFSPSLFIYRETLLGSGGFDERFRYLEDYPLWLNLTRNGHKLHFMDKVTVNYRRHSTAINNTGKDFLINPNYFRQEEFRKIYTYPFLPLDIRLQQRFDWIVTQIFRFYRINKKKRTTRFLLNLLTIYLNPFKYYIYLKKVVRRELKSNEFYN